MQEKNAVQTTATNRKRRVQVLKPRTERHSVKVDDDMTLGEFISLAAAIFTKNKNEQLCVC